MLSAIATTWAKMPRFPLYTGWIEAGSGGRMGVRWCYSNAVSIYVMSCYVSKTKHHIKPLFEKRTEAVYFVSGECALLNFEFWWNHNPSVRWRWWTGQVDVVEWVHKISKILLYGTFLLTSVYLRYMKSLTILNKSKETTRKVLLFCSYARKHK